jgi:tetratricopeptide (TPR) repeat protein
MGIEHDAHLELGELEQAETVLQKMLDTEPGLPSYSRASYLRWLRGDVEGAKEAAKLALDAANGMRDPEPAAWMICEAAKLVWHEGAYARAEAGFDLALSRAPAHAYAPALLGKAKVKLALGKPEEAALLARRSFELSPLVESAWVWGDAERLAGRGDAAKQAFAEAVRVGRQTDGRSLALFYAVEDRDIEEAVKLASEEMSSRRDVYTYDAYAWALYRAKRIPEAKAAIERATRLGTRDAMLQYHAGAIAIAGGEVKQGRELVRAALATNPNFHPVMAREARLLAPKTKP